MCPETMLTITRCDKATAKLMADNALNRSPEWFYETYGVLWPMKWFSSIIAFFVWDELRYMGAAAQTVSGCKERMTIDRIRRRYDAAELPADLWIGDTTVDMLINTFLVAFIDNGYGVDEEDDDITMEEFNAETYYKIRGELCKLHLKKPYKGWKIYRAWNVNEGHGKMKYFAVKDDEILSARNLSGIKDEVSKVS